MDATLRNALRAATASPGDAEAAERLRVARQRAGYPSLAEWGSAFGSDGAGVADLLDQVCEVIAAQEGENDYASWIGLFKLETGKYLGLTAWCDFTGWG